MYARVSGLSGCGCPGLCCGGVRGLGLAEGESLFPSLPQGTVWDVAGTDVLGFPLWAWALGGLGLFWMLAPGGSEYRAAKSRLAARYSEEERKIRREHRGVRRVARQIRRGAGHSLEKVGQSLV